MAKRKKQGCLLSLIGFIWIGYFIVILLGAFFTGLEAILNNNTNDSERIKLADGFTISAYNVKLDVKENNVVYVTEKITVNWEEYYHHGIYKFTPEWLTYTGKDGKEIKRKSLVKNYKAIGDLYTTDVVKKKPRIKIGSPDYYVPLGNKTYIIAYTYDMGKDPFKGFDEFIFHAFGDYWGTEIKNASIEITMPKNFDKSNVNFFLDKKRWYSANDFVDYEIIGNTLYAKFNQDKYSEYQEKEYCESEYHINDDGTCSLPYYETIKTLNKSLTVDIELPENYFVGGHWNYGFISFILCLIVFVITFKNFKRWQKYGKDFPKRAQTVEFYPPDNLSAAEIGYIYGKQATKKLTISLIIQLASKGFIRIDDLKDKDKNIQITNLMAKPKEPSNYDLKVPKRIIKIKKLKDKDDNLSKEEKTMMSYLFKKSDEKELSTSIEKFLNVKDSLVSKGYIEIIEDNEQDRIENLKYQQEKYEEDKKQYKIDLEEYIKRKEKLESLTALEELVYDRLFEKENEIILSEHTTFYKTFDDVERYLRTNLKDLVDDKTATKKMILSIFISILVFILYYLAYSVFEDMDPSWKVIYILAFLCGFINIYFTLIMKRKTEYYMDMIARIKGFRSFLLTVEKENLEIFVAKNPNYFYNILPYTYVLNISKKWIKKFENIPYPEMDMGSYDFENTSYYYKIYDNVYYPEPVVHYSSSGGSSSGCSSCGGGCSSCGGGCSSCGGGGSW